MAKKTDIVDRAKVYAYRWPGEKRASGIAIYVDADYYGFKGLCYLTPPDRGHMIQGRLGRKTESGFTFVSEGYAAGEWEFIEVTYDGFCKEYHKLVEGGGEIIAEVSNTQELQDWYHRNFPM